MHAGFGAPYFPQQWEAIGPEILLDLFPGKMVEIYGVYKAYQQLHEGWGKQASK